MKKYGKSIVLIIFTNVVLIGYFILSAGITGLFPQFMVETMEGNDEAIEPVYISGDFYSGSIGVEPFRFHKDETVYLRDMVLLPEYRSTFPPLEMERHQKDYRNFMRGKSPEPKYFYEDEHVLVYGGLLYEPWTYDSQAFEIAVLNKETGKTANKAFTVPIPNQHDYWYVEAHKVTYDGKYVSIITENSVRLDESNDKEAETEFYQYTFDVEKEQLTKEHLITSIDYTPEDYSQMMVLEDGRVDNDSVYIAQEKITYVEGASEESGTELSEIEKVVKYDLNTRKTVEKDAVKNVSGKAIVIYNGKLYVANEKGEGLQLTGYHLDDGKKAEEMFLPLQLPYHDIASTITKVKDDKLYLMTIQSEEGTLPYIAVIDLPSFTLDYLGKMENMNPAKNGDWTEVYISELSVSEK